MWHLSQHLFYYPHSTNSVTEALPLAYAAKKAGTPYPPSSQSGASFTQGGTGCWCFSSASARRCRGLFWTGTQSLGFHSFVHSPLIWWKLYSRPSRQRILDLDCYHPNVLIMPGGVGQEDQGLPPPLPPSARGGTLGKVGS